MHFWEQVQKPPDIAGFTVSVEYERKQPALQRLGNQSVNAHWVIIASYHDIVSFLQNELNTLDSWHCDYHIKWGSHL